MTTRFGDLLAMEALGDGEYRAEPVGGGFLYGGLTMAMALNAAADTVDDSLVPLSLSARFLSFGEWGPTDVTIDDVDTRRSFATRRASLRQGDDRRLVATAELLFHRPDHGADTQHVAVATIDPPDALASEPTVLGTRDPVDPFEVRPAAGHGVATGDRLHPFWARTREAVDDGPARPAALAFMSDYFVIRSPFAPGQREGDGLRSFTLEHAVWFHRTVDPHQWMLFDCAPATQSNGRYVSHGTVTDEAGRLLASFVQSGFVRPAR